MRRRHSLKTCKEEEPCMALTGELSDLSLAELIELFCNQRKTGRLKVIYSVGPGYFYLQAGSVVHARIGVLRGIEAVYFALTLPNASFTFSPAFDAPEQTINQPWTSVVLEGLRRMDEGIKPADPFPDGHDVGEELKAAEPEAQEPKPVEPKVAQPSAKEQMVPASNEAPHIPVLSQKIEKPVFKSRPAEMPEFGAFLSQSDKASRFGSWKLITVMAAVVLIIGAIAVPWGWYARSKAAKLANEAQTVPSHNSQPAAQPLTTNETAVAPEPSDSVLPVTSEAADVAAKRAREARLKERAAKVQESGTALAPGQSAPSVASPSAAKAQSSPAAGSKKAVVQVTYDENGRVTQASGGDATALRIARQKRFPAGKAGSATITIPIN
ncbi:MAG: hypothetical protein QOG23_1052 [Blastocatellia bacterium]|nr:hypothetical protein [Blastocatellia bacterium]